MRSLRFIIAALALCFSVYAASDTRSGVWTAELQDDHLQMTLFRGKEAGDRNAGILMGFDEPLASFAGLSKSDLRSSAANVQFELRRAAGTVSFEGRVANGTGAGHYRFTPNDGFVREMDSLGYRGFNDDQLLVFAVHDLTLQTIRELREFARHGYPGLSLQEAVNFQVGRVDAACIKDLRELGYGDLSASKLADMVIIGVRPAYIRELRALGYDKLTLRQLIDMKIFGVTPDYIRKLSEKGYNNIPVDKLLKLRTMGADKILFKMK